MRKRETDDDGKGAMVHGFNDDNGVIKITEKRCFL
jgi:hypothetical protein